MNKKKNVLLFLGHLEKKTEFEIYAIDSCWYAVQVSWLCQSYVCVFVSRTPTVYQKDLVLFWSISIERVGNVIFNPECCTY